MILRPFRILTFVEKKWLSPLFHFVSLLYISSTRLNPAQPGSTRLNPAQPGSTFYEWNEKKKIKMQINFSGPDFSDVSRGKEEIQPWVFLNVYKITIQSTHTWVPWKSTIKENLLWNENGKSTITIFSKIFKGKSTNKKTRKIHYT